MKFYDEDEAVKYIFENISENISKETVLDIIDLIFDYYEQNGDLDLDFDEDLLNNQPDSDIDSICNYILENHDDDMPSSNIINEIVKAELDYEASLLD